MSQTLTNNRVIAELRSRRWRKQSRVARWQKYTTDANICPLILRPINPTNLTGGWILIQTDPHRPDEEIKSWPSAKAMFRDGAAETPAV